MKSIIFEYFDITYFIIYYNMKKKKIRMVRKWWNQFTVWIFFEAIFYISYELWIN